VEGRAKLGITEGFFRVSVGVEEEGILVSEMLRAADAARGQSAT
jgi:cystathionine beta-lyase/cystathionine gamma-synthase